MPSVPALNAVTTITPNLINQVNLAASSNPILANLVQLAAAGKATAEQLKTLGLLIQSLASTESAQLASLPISQSQPDETLLVKSPSGIQDATTSNSPVKEFDLVIEFREMPSERWLFPRGPVVYEKAVENDNDHDIINTAYDTVIKTILPFDNTSSAAASGAPPLKGSLPIDDSRHVATFRLRKTPSRIWDTISRWAGSEEKVQQSQKIFDALVRLP